jgi:triosephosphate isomerase
MGNWKMNLDFVEALHLVQEIGVVVHHQPLEHTDLVVAAPFVDLRTVCSVVESEQIPMGVGAQHVSQFESGAHTGEVSVSMLRRLGVTWVIVGHSERRTHYAMSDDVVAATLATVLRAGLNAVLCVGEDEEHRRQGDHQAFVGAQLASALTSLSPTARSAVTVAYEPLWAIGTGVSASIEEITEMGAFVRSTLDGLGASGSRVLYGGSVNEENAGEIADVRPIDGFLVGGASLRAASFLAIGRACDDCYAGKR